MTGFIGRLFAPKAKVTEDTKAEAPVRKEAAAKPAKQENAFFLEMDDARTMGNLEYMRAAKQVKRTYPKTVDSPDEMKMVKIVSATEMTIAGDKYLSAPAPKSEAQPPEQPAAPVTNEAAERRRTDTSMDMFRNMAKDIRK
jgi:hypothetical protein